MWGKLSILLALQYVEGGIRLDPLVVTKQGLIKGLRVDEDYSMFLGIPYANIDRENPFGIAQPHPKSHLIYEAIDDPPACPQMLNGDPIGNLDCLRLNIFVPNKATSRNRLPVIVWLYGGAFNVGYNTQHYYGASYLIKHDVIVVTVNYRVGPYGFMCLNTPDVPGNQGLKDQLLALRWINDNIEPFGGDVDKITLMGESAGSASVEAHLLSKSEKLFNNIIMQSGSLFKPGRTSLPDGKVPLDIAEQLGLKTDNISEALSFISKEDPKSVISAATKLSWDSCLCLEDTFDNVESIITESPYSTDVPKVKGTDVLVGFNSREGLLMNARNPNDYIVNPNYFKDTLADLFDYDASFNDMDHIVRHFYIGDAKLTKDVNDNIIDYKSDYFYNVPNQRSVDKLLMNGAGNIYQYVFSYDGGLNYFKDILNISLPGAAHGDELGYLFDMGLKTEPSATDLLVIDRMTTMWTNFAKYGNPIPFETNLLPVKWEPITNATIPCLNIDAELTMTSRPFYRRLTFWEVFLAANQKSLRDYKRIL